MKAPGEIEIVGYQFEPQRLLPGENASLTLFMRLIEPLPDAFQTTVRLVSVADGQVVAQSESLTPQSLAVGAWQPGQVVAERFVTATTTNMPIGAYLLNFSLSRPGDVEAVWPLYRNNDVNPLDRVALGFTAVPWQGDLSPATPINANFDDQIRLSAFAIAGDSTPGETLPVELFWEPLQPPQEEYVVFVHILDSAGNLVGSHDGQPVEGRFPTNTWLVGDVIQDVHQVPLDPDLSAGFTRSK